LISTQQFISYIMSRTRYLRWDDNDIDKPTRLAFQWNNSLQVDMSLQSDTLFWFRSHQSSLLLLNVACLVEKRSKY
jgi:hypothetical protein